MVQASVSPRLGFQSQHLQEDLQDVWENGNLLTVQQRGNISFKKTWQMPIVIVTSGEIRGYKPYLQGTPRRDVLEIVIKVMQAI